MGPISHLCPCCAAHLHISDGLVTMRCENCASSLVLVSRGGVSGLLLLPDAPPVPYSDPRLGPRAVNGVMLAQDAWRGLLVNKLRKRSGYAFAFTVFAAVTGIDVVGVITALHSVAVADKHSLEPAAATFLAGLIAIPLLGFVAAFFWDRFLVACHEVGDVRRRLPLHQ